MKKLHLTDLLKDDELDPNLAVIEGKDSLIITEHDFVHWIEREQSVEIEIFDGNLNSRIVTLRIDELLTRLREELDITEWGHYWGIKSRVASNYQWLLRSMREIGLSTDDMPEFYDK